MSRLQGFLARLMGIQELRHDALNEGDGHSVILKNPLLGLSVGRAQRLEPRIPPVHEMIGAEHIPEQPFGIAFQLAENLRWELVVLFAERSDPGRER